MLKIFFELVPNVLLRCCNEHSIQFNFESNMIHLKRLNVLVGVRLLVGDVVWGKIHGFPWWPGKILTITSCGNQNPQAHVSWYGSSTSSLMECNQLSPYLDNFKVQ